MHDAYFCITTDKRKRLLEVAAGKRMADLYFRGARVLNTYSGELLPTNIAVFGDRIAYAGFSEAMIGENTQVVDVQGKVLSPGYIEPHSHPFLLYNPVTFSQKIMSLGTTLIVNDTWPFITTKSDFKKMPNILKDFRKLAVRTLWSMRLNLSDVESGICAPEDLEAIIRLPETIQVGELTEWRSLLDVSDGSDIMLDWLNSAYISGKMVELHAPGSSSDTLGKLALAGGTACHESITAEEVRNRLRQGLYATIRHSTLRPDLPEIVRELLKTPVSTHRLMVTLDGPTPIVFEHGFTDYLVNELINSGMDPIQAYQLVTINPATYYGIDEHVGGLAPGRLADILVLEDILKPTPLQVYIGGKLVAESGRSLLPQEEYPWLDYDFGKPVPAPTKATFTPEVLSFTTEGAKDSYPLMDLVSAAIIRRRNIPLSELQGGLPEHALIAAHCARDGSWLSKGIISGFAKDIGAIATTYTFSGDITVLGNDPKAMAAAIHRVTELGGGLVVIDKGETVFELALELNGLMSLSPIDVVIEKACELVSFLRKKGYVHTDPIYTLYFLSTTHLPDLRLTSDGLVDIKKTEIVLPAISLMSIKI
jgi:adenine deaminase